MHFVFSTLIDLVIVTHACFEHVANLLSNAEVRRYGKSIKKYIPLFADYGIGIVDNSSVAKRMWTLMTNVVFGCLPDVGNFRPQGSYEFYDGSVFLSKNSRGSQNLDQNLDLKKTKKIYIATMNDTIDMTQYFNKISNSLHKDNAIQLNDIVLAYARTEDEGDVRDMLAALAARPASLVVTDLSSNDFNERVYSDPEEYIVFP